MGRNKNDAMVGSKDGRMSGGTDSQLVDKSEQVGNCGNYFNDNHKLHPKFYFIPFFSTSFKL